MGNFVALENGESGFNTDNVTCWSWSKEEEQVKVFFLAGDARWAKYRFKDPLQFVQALRGQPFKQD